MSVYAKCIDYKGVSPPPRKDTTCLPWVEIRDVRKGDLGCLIQMEDGHAY